MLNTSIGVVGLGFVGRAVMQGFSNHVRDIYGYDNDPARHHSTLDLVLATEFVFVCLPTPADLDGECDLSAIEDFFGVAAMRLAGGSGPTFILKSTVPPGTTARIAAQHKLRIFHSPEFLSARTAAVDFVTPSRVILGHPVIHRDGWKQDMVDSAKALRLLFENRFPGVPLHVMSARESELVKYGVNGFFATKITYFNELREICEQLNCDWDTVLKGILSDGRIAHSHTEVPGHDGQLGFGGACLPKDLSALIAVAEGADVEPELLVAVQAKNASIRHTAGTPA